MAAAQAGDVVTVAGGSYEESLATVRPGAEGTPITVRRAPGGGEVIVTASGRVLTVSHPYHRLEGLTLDGQVRAPERPTR